MSYEDIACMQFDDLEKTIKELLAIAQAVAILGQGIPISRKLEEAARRFL